MPSSKLLKTYLDTKKKETLVLGAVERHLLRQISNRDTTVLHPSEICHSDWCLRASWFLLNGHAKPLDPPNLRLSSIFAEGHSIHDKWQGWFTEMGAMIGVWKCAVHDDLWWGKRQDAHPDCLVTFNEVPVFGMGLIEGHADGWLDHTVIETLGADHLLEIKSIGTGTVRANGGRIHDGLENTFAAINAPFTPHVRQATLYLWLLHQMYRDQELPQVPPEHILFLYECKADQAVKEFSVAYDEDWLEPVFKRLNAFDPDSPIPPPCTSGEVSCKQCKGYVVV